jgi:hypothetical protein
MRERRNIRDGNKREANQSKYIFFKHTHNRTEQTNKPTTTLTEKGCAGSFRAIAKIKY